MSKASDFFTSHLGADGQIKWPELPEGRTVLARELFGLGFVGAHDYWVQRAVDLLTNAQPASPPIRHNQAWREEMAFRERFSSLTQEQRAAVEGLVRLVVSGALFSALVSLDQFPRAEVEVGVLTGSANPAERRIAVAPTDEDLHDLFFTLLERFSAEYRGRNGGVPAA